MKLTDKDIKEFQTIYQRKYDVELDKQTAKIKLLMLVRLMEIVHDSSESEGAVR
jgi:hypothetical protein